MRISGRDLSAGLRVQEDAVVRDGEDAREFVGNDYDRGAQAVAQFQDQVVQQAAS